MIPQNGRCDNPSAGRPASGLVGRPEITLSEPPDLDAVGRRWRGLERQAAGSFFQSWAWVGCLASERFDRPLLLEARQDGELVAMALFNRQPRRWPRSTRLLLGESGTPALDAVFVEHNGILAGPDAAHDVVPACLRAILALRLPLTLSGVDGAYLHATEAAGVVAMCRQRMAPHVDLSAVRRAGGGYLGCLSGNARYQLRRSAKSYAAHGALRVTRAESAAAAHRFLEVLGVLHQQTWTRRGQAGAFANPAFVRFHHTLIDRAFDDGTIDLLCITAGEQTLGYLYNLRHGGRVSAYQSGFDYANAATHQKPGLTCHHQAIERCLDGKDAIYDFLAGDGRYKTSLSTATTPLFWLDLVPARSLSGMFATARSWVPDNWRQSAAAIRNILVRPG